ncbi:MAG: prolipoprotein diacylglyceryl transferase [Planctomycetota bacterium]|nr:prolipoprotein diacylglyceryl transferase [Planctomycetota bacterium]
MQQILGTLTLGPFGAILGLIIAVFWGWVLLGRHGPVSFGIRLKATLSGVFSLGFCTLWPDQKKPDLLNPSILAAISLYLLFSGTRFEIPVFGYGFCLMVGFVAAISLASARARRLGVDPNHILDLGMIAVALGVFGARLFYYIEHYSDKFADRSLWDFFAVWEGGIVYYGGLIFASLACIAYLRWRAYRVLLLGDIVAPTLALGLSFGRLGCFFNGCCWGQVCPADTPLAVQFPRQSFAWWQHIEKHTPTVELQAFQDGSQSIEQVLASVPPDLHDWSLFVYPTQFYSWLGAIAVALLVLAYEKWGAKKEGQSFAMFFALYAAVRFFLEVFRGDSTNAFDMDTGTLTQGQSVSLIVFVLALVSLFALHWKGRPRSLAVDLSKDLDVVD